MINLLPQENFFMNTKLSPAEIVTRLSESAKYETFGDGYRENKFNIKRIINYRNSFLPLIKGEMMDLHGTTNVKVEMKPHWFVTVFMLFWLGGVAIAFILTLDIIEERELDFFSLLPFIMFFFGIAFFYGGFKFESKRSKKELLSLLEGEEC